MQRHPGIGRDALGHLAPGRVGGQRGRVACEALLTTGTVVVAGEITTQCYVELPDLVRRTIEELGEEIFQLMLAVASGQRSKSELHGYGQRR